VKQLVERIRDDLYLLQDKLEIDIMKKYAANIRFMTLFSIGKSIDNNYSIILVYLAHISELCNNHAHISK
jgi:hypothetical protein